MRAASRLIHQVQRLWWSLAHPLTLGVRVLLVDRGQVVLVYHRYLDGWYLPGGGVGSHETPEQAIRREAYEELGATIEQLELFGIYTNFVEGKRDHIVVFRGTADLSTTYQSWEIAQVGSFALDTLPPTTSPGTRRRIAELGDSPGSRYRPW